MVPGIETHYRTLGIEPTATQDEIRAAYRRAARAHHPDAAGGSPDRMARINEAWGVLGDRDRRRRYDREVLDGHSDGTSTAEPAPSATTPRVVVADLQPARFPWKLMTVMAAVGIAIVVVGSVTYRPSSPLPPDRLVTAGSCVVFEPNGDAREVLCTDPHDGVVESVVSFDERCAYGLEPHRDQQGLGIACVRAP